MVKSRENIIKNLDWLSITTYLLLVLIGWISIYSAVYNESFNSIFDISQRYGKQLMWIGAAIVIAIIIIIIEPRFFNQFAYPIYAAGLVLLLLTLFIGKEVAGAHSWLQIGSFSLQPAEFVKFGTALALAHYLSNLEKDFKGLKVMITAMTFIIIPVSIIFLQNDTGSALVYASFIFVFYRVGLSGNVFIIGLTVVIMAILALVLNTLNQRLILIGVLLLLGSIYYLFSKKTIKNLLKVIAVVVALSSIIFTVDFAFSKLQDYQQKRIKVLLNLEEDPYGTGYNIIQSKIAIGSGGFFGKGFLNGTQTKYDFVPEQSTDFIFCTIGEEYGFLGTSMVISLYLFLLIRLILIAERQRSKFSKIYGYAVVSIIFFHFTINIGMVIGLLPVIGIPLPFISYGGSSLWAFTILLFVFLRQDAERYNLL